VLIDENRDGNIPLIMIRGSCGIYKKGMNALDNFIKWQAAATPYLKNQPDFASFCERMRDVVARMTPSMNIYLGEVGENEPVGFECMFGDEGKGLFGVTVSTVEMRYYPMPKNAQKYLFGLSSIRPKVLAQLMSVLKYRLSSLENILELLGKKDELHISEGADFGRLVKSKALLASYHHEAEKLTDSCVRLTSSKAAIKPNQLPRRTRLTDGGLVSTLDYQNTRLLTEDPSLSSAAYDVSPVINNYKKNKIFKKNFERKIEEQQKRFTSIKTDGAVSTISQNKSRPELDCKSREDLININDKNSLLQRFKGINCKNLLSRDPNQVRFDEHTFVDDRNLFENYLKLKNSSQIVKKRILIQKQNENMRKSQERMGGNVVPGLDARPGSVIAGICSRNNIRPLSAAWNPLSSIANSSSKELSRPSMKQTLPPTSSPAQTPRGDSPERYVRLGSPRQEGNAHINIEYEKTPVVDSPTRPHYDPRTDYKQNAPPTTFIMGKKKSKRFPRRVHDQRDNTHNRSQSSSAFSLKDYELNNHPPNNNYSISDNKKSSGLLNGGHGKVHRPNGNVKSAPKFFIVKKARLDDNPFGLIEKFCNYLY